MIEQQVLTVDSRRACSTWRCAADRNIDGQSWERLAREGMPAGARAGSTNTTTRSNSPTRRTSAASAPTMEVHPLSARRRLARPAPGRAVRPEGRSGGGRQPDASRRTSATLRAAAGRTADADGGQRPDPGDRSDADRRRHQEGAAGAEPSLTVRLYGLAVLRSCGRPVVRLSGCPGLRMGRL